MDQTALYEEDIYAWSQHQARVLRGLAASGLRLPNDLDLEHVAEEIEEVGNEQRFACESNLIRALIHLIKIVALQEDLAARHWTTEANTFLDTAARRYRPSMRQTLDPAKIWSHACRRATQDLEVNGHAVPPLPREPPLAFDALVADEADARDLAAQLASSIAALRHGHGS